MKVKFQHPGQVKIIVNRSDEEVGISSEKTVPHLKDRLFTAGGKASVKEAFTVNRKSVKQISSMRTTPRQGDNVALSFPVFPKVWYGQPPNVIAVVLN